MKAARLVAWYSPDGVRVGWEVWSPSGRKVGRVRYYAPLRRWQAERRVQTVGWTVLPVLSATRAEAVAWIRLRCRRWWDR